MQPIHRHTQFLWTILLLLIFSAGACLAAEGSKAKLITFAICEDYDKNQDLKDVAQDFKLVKQLGIDTMRVSFGWDDYEPENNKFDFAWLHKFASLAQQHGLKLRPYLCYAPDWATGGGWNKPAKDIKDWYDYCYTIAKEMKVHPNIVSWEIWNEEDLGGAKGWFNGTIDQFMTLLRAGSLAVRAADPSKQILVGGFARPRSKWMQAIASAGYGRYYDVTPMHCYAETWGRKRTSEVESSLSEDYLAGFLVANNTLGGGQPIWVNEIGYSTMDRTEEQQANYLVRAVGYFFSRPEVTHMSWYEVKDLKPDSVVIGDAHNRHLGITRWPDRKPKLAFYTLDMLTDLLDDQQVTPALDEATLRVTAGAPDKLYKWLFKRADGSQVLFVYSKGVDCTVDVTLATPGKTAEKYELKNTHAPYAGFANNTISGLKLIADQVAVFKITP